MGTNLNRHCLVETRNGRGYQPAFDTRNRPEGVCSHVRFQISVLAVPGTIILVGHCLKLENVFQCHAYL